MSHKAIRTLIKRTAEQLGDDIQFTYARKSDFNVMKGKRYPFIVLDPLDSNPLFAVNNTLNYTKTWAVDMAFYALDKSDSTGDQYAEILDEMDSLIDQFIIKLNFSVLDLDGVVITNVSQNNFIKATADILTGYFLSLRIQVPDTFEYCANGC